MTLAARNRILLFEYYLFIFCTVVISAIFFIALFFNKIVPPPETLYNSNLFILKYQFYSVIISIFVMMFFTIFTTLFIYKHFVKTRSSEIYFFCAFLLGCFAESLRLLIPIQGLWRSYSPLLLFIGQVVILGRILCPISWLFIALMSEPEQRLNEDRNMILILMTSLIFGTIIPVNTSNVTGICTVQWGYENFFFLFRIMIFSLSGISIFLTNKKQDINQTKQIVIGYVILIFGYTLLCNTDTYLKLIISTFTFFFGSYLYLTNTHKKYLWM